MSHEMRTPLNSIIGLSDLISHSNLEEEQARQIQVILKSGEVLKNLIDDIIDITKIESGNVVLHNVPLDFNDLTEKVVQIFQYEAGKKNIDLNFHVEKSLGRFEGDAVRISQILIKLIGNAIKYTPHGQVTVKVRANDPRDTKGNVLISVTDDGIGIYPSKQEMIFEKFTQAEGATCKKYGGTGLGLAITKNLVELMNGRIWVNSQPGRGSEFSLTLNLRSLEPDEKKINELCKY